MKFWALIVVVLELLCASSAMAGTGSGNGFFRHCTNPTFDFHIAAPPTWIKQGCRSASAQELASAAPEIWLFAAPDAVTPASPEGTQLQVMFLTDYPAANIGELKSSLNKLRPEVNWQPFDRSAFTGFTSAAAGDSANQADEYYLVQPHLVIYISWQRDPNNASDEVLLEAIKNSINRESAPPKIDSIKMDHKSPYQPGDEACYGVQVNDLRDEFDDESLTTFDVAGAPPHWSFKSIKWLPKMSLFRICLPVTLGFAEKGLQITALSIGGGHSTDCTADTKDSTVLSCSNNRQLKPDVTPVINAAPVQDGPLINHVIFDATLQTISIDAESRAGILGAELRQSVADDSSLDGASFYLFADDLNQNQPVAIGSMFHLGMNVIDTIVVYDKTGRATLLRLPTVDSTTGISRNYEAVSWSGAKSATIIPVVSYLKTGERK